jgi:Cu+-exporting ATPase
VLPVGAFSATVAAGDPVCGNAAGLRYYSEAVDVKSGPCVDLLNREARAGEPVTLRFFVSEKRSGQPLEKLDVQHQKLLHVIGVREDLNEFFHLHPVKVGPGLWEVHHTFPSAGKYKIWADIACSGATFTLAQPLLTVAGEQKSSTTTARISSRVNVSGFEISISHNEPLIAGIPNALVFTIRDGSGQIIETEDFLGAPMHLVGIGENLVDFRHAHPETAVSSAAGIRFRQVLEEPGKYRLFAQFRPVGARLGPDEALLAEFYVDVISAKAASSLTRR